MIFPRKITLNLHLTGSITFDEQQSVPAAGTVQNVTFFWSDDMPMVGLITLAPIADTTITAKPCLVTFDIGTPITVDMIDPTATFTVPDGASSGTATPQPFTNPQGQGPAGAPFPFTVSTTPPSGGLPPAGVVTNVGFTDSNAPAINPLIAGMKR